MTGLVAAVLWAGVGLGAAVMLAGLRGIQLAAPSSTVKSGSWRLDGSAPGIRRGGLAILAALVGFVVTGWAAAGLLAGVAVWGLPQALGGRRARENEIARTEAIAAWTEMLRGSIVVGAGLEEAITATGPVAPLPIRTEVRALVARLEHQRFRLPDALATFGSELQHPSGDLVVAALVLAARTEASDLSGLLTRLAAATREDARMRTRVETSRARIRTGGRIILAVTAATVAILAVADRGYLDAFNGLQGQVVLLVAAGCFGGGGWLLARMAQVGIPDRVRIRADVVGNGSGEGAW
jgi:tight adherence protein B